MMITVRDEFGKQEQNKHLTHSFLGECEENLKILSQISWPQY